MRRSAFVAAVTLVVAAAAIPAWAITNGSPDNGSHPNVGALIAVFESGGEELAVPICTGTLLEGNVFLTAAHCVTGLAPFLGTEDFVLAATFRDDLEGLAPSDTDLIPATTWVAHPASGSFGGDPKSVDVGLLVLEASPAGIEPAQLADPGAADRIDRKTQRFTAVGYGLSRGDPKRKGPHTLFFDGLRRYSEQSATHANASWLKLSMNPANGNAGTCYGDSGGPHFLGTGSSTSPGTIVSVTSWGDRYCRSTDWTARVDTETVHAFVASHMVEPD